MRRGGLGYCGEVSGCVGKGLVARGESEYEMSIGHMEKGGQGALEELGVCGDGGRDM